MTTQVEKLIERAYKLAGLFQEDRILGGTQQQEALEILNELLDNFAGNTAEIAFYQTLQFPVVAGQQCYILAPSGGDVVSNRLIELKYCVLISGDARYPVKVIKDYEYYTQIYYETSGACPYGVFLQNEIGKSILTFIYKPDTNYTADIKGKFILSHLALNSEITNVPAYYIIYLRYILAKQLALEFMASNWTTVHEQELEKIENKIINMSDTDYSIRTDCGRSPDYRLGVII